MFKKNKETKPPKQNKDIVQTVTIQQAYEKQFNEIFAEIERTTDTADRVLKLQQLARDISSADSHIRGRRNVIVNNRTNKKSAQARLTGYAGGAAAVAIPGAIVFPPLLGFIAVGGLVGLVTGQVSMHGRIKEKSQELVAQDTDLNYFQVLLAEKREQVKKMLDETVKNCDLEKLPLCPNFETALGSCTPLRERFAKAAIAAAKQASEEKPEAQPRVDKPAKAPGEARPSNRLKIKRLGD